jgi:hypothetical protein
MNLFVTDKLAVRSLSKAASRHPHAPADETPEGFSPRAPSRAGGHCHGTDYSCDGNLILRYQHLLRIGGSIQNNLNMFFFDVLIVSGV